MGTVLGCDVSKQWIDVQGLDSEAPLRLENAKRAIVRWAKGLPAGSVIGMEATGQLHEVLAETLYELGHTVFVINPRWIHRYAGGVGQRGKSDRLDAQLIARFVNAEGHHLHAYRPPTAQEAQLRHLLLRRLQVVKLKIAARQSLGDQAGAVLKELRRLLAELDRQIAQLIAGNPQWKAAAIRLQTIPGVGPLVAAHLVQVLMRFPFRGADAFVAHTGTDPRPNDSGQRRGRRRLTHHGDAALRKMLYMAALATRSKAEWRELYQAQRAKGLAPTAALIVIARKLARIAFHIFKTNETYDAQHLGLSARA